MQPQPFRLPDDHRKRTAEEDSALCAVLNILTTTGGNEQCLWDFCEDRLFDCITDPELALRPGDAFGLARYLLDEAVAPILRCEVGEVDVPAEAVAARREVLEYCPWELLAQVLVDVVQQRRAGDPAYSFIRALFLSQGVTARERILEALLAFRLQPGVENASSAGLVAPCLRMIDGNDDLLEPNAGTVRLVQLLSEERARNEALRSERASADAETNQ